MRAAVALMASTGADGARRPATSRRPDPARSRAAPTAASPPGETPASARRPPPETPTSAHSPGGVNSRRLAHPVAAAESDPPPANARAAGVGGRVGRSCRRPRRRASRCGNKKTPRHPPRTAGPIPAAAGKLPGGERARVGAPADRPRPGGAVLRDPAPRSRGGGAGPRLVGDVAEQRRDAQLQFRVEVPRLAGFLEMVRHRAETREHEQQQQRRATPGCASGSSG